MIEKSERNAARAEAMGLEEEAAICRNSARICREIRDGFRKAGEEV